jgi:hypothetical protein
VQQRALELHQKEQELDAAEQFLEQREAELLMREKLLDSASGRLQDSVSYKTIEDSLLISHPQVPGLYRVTMRCTQTNCSGSAVGDTKNEEWEIAYEHNSVVIKATSGKKLIRLYKGVFSGPAIELEAQPDSLTAAGSGKIIVRLQQTKQNRLEGVREITGTNDCRIVYNLSLRKL